MIANEYERLTGGRLVRARVDLANTRELDGVQRADAFAEGATNRPGLLRRVRGSVVVEVDRVDEHRLGRAP